MPAPWRPLSVGGFLRLFVVCLALVIVSLVGLLFLVDLEAVTPATGFVTARGLHEMRAVFPGIIEAGWYEGVVILPDGTSHAIRVDAYGDGLADPARGAFRSVVQYQLLDGDRKVPVVRQSLRFHKARAGDELWPGQVLAAMRTEELRFKLGQAEERLRHAESHGTGSAEFDAARADRDWLRHQLRHAVWTVPTEADLWQIVDVPVVSGQAVEPGQLVATVVPLDPATRQPLDLVVRLDLDEDDAGDLAPGQDVRLFSTVHNYRIHGWAEATVERIEPLGEEVSGGKRRFHAIAVVTRTPFTLPLGSSCKAEIVVGKKPVYRIILEH